MRRKSIPKLNRSRFCEGSMSDRVSAAPPSQFLGPEDRDSLEHPFPITTILTGTTTTTCTSASAEPSNTHSNRSSQTFSRKTGSRIFGQVWDGVRGKLGLKKDGEQLSTNDKHSSLTSDPLAALFDAAPPSSRTRSKKQPADFTSRDDVLTSYHQLVEQGFFKSHAIQSSRMPGPGPPPRQPPPPVPPHAKRPATSYEGAPPTWPLTPAKAAPTPRCVTQIASPASASSRGTKRAAAQDSDDCQDDEDHDPNKENTTPQRKLRKLALSGDGVFNPKIRGAPRHAAGSIRRSISAHHQPNKLTKRAPTPIAGFARPKDGRRTSSVTSRMLRPKNSAEPMSVVPDANRGVPNVPAIPPKFTYGEDREAGAPWRGLRIR